MYQLCILNEGGNGSNVKWGSLKYKKCRTKGYDLLELVMLQVHSNDINGWRRIIEIFLIKRFINIII